MLSLLHRMTSPTRCLLALAMRSPRWVLQLCEPLFNARSAQVRPDPKAAWPIESPRRRVLACERVPDFKRGRPMTKNRAAIALSATALVVAVLGQTAVGQRGSGCRACMPSSLRTQGRSTTSRPRGLRRRAGSFPSTRRGSSLRPCSPRHRRQAAGRQAAGRIRTRSSSTPTRHHTRPAPTRHRSWPESRTTRRRILTSSKSSRGIYDSAPALRRDEGVGRRRGLGRGASRRSSAPTASAPARSSGPITRNYAYLSVKNTVAASSRWRSSRRALAAIHARHCSGQRRFGELWHPHGQRLACAQRT